MICYSVLSIFLVRQFVVPAEASIIENMRINHARRLLFLIKRQTMRVKTVQNEISTPAKKGPCSPQPHSSIFPGHQKMYQLFCFFTIRCFNSSDQNKCSDNNNKCQRSNNMIHHAKTKSVYPHTNKWVC